MSAQLQDWQEGATSWKSVLWSTKGSICPRLLMADADWPFFVIHLGASPGSDLLFPGNELGGYSARLPQ